ncbi:fibrinogen-related protein 3.1 [Elysia marginata]|uniref:Fibrinogen-related protein 3.1 n=1 Tax=Elysia marginata TaxID=1093978 RepID=A0AAV4IJA8_9GAST|nr:fibrinogen-related protein 3.1 [Elysia marginata]
MELTLSRDVSNSGRKGCGVILCKEEIPHTSRNVTSTGVNSDQSDKLVSPNSILEMSLFKHARSSAATFKDAGSDQKHLLASLSSLQPSMTRVSNGIKVEGQLTGERATLRLWLYKQKDCRSEYSCRVVKVDGQGKQLLSNSHLLQQTWDGGDGRISQVESRAVWSPVVAMNILSAVHQIDNKLAQAGSAASDSWQPRVQTLENRIEDKITSFENHVEDEIASMQNRLENKIESLENRLEDKMVLFERSLQNEFVKLQSKLGDIIADQMSALKSELTTAVARQESEFETTMKSSIKDNLVTLRQDLKTTEGNILEKVDLVAANLHSDLNATRSEFSSMENNYSFPQAGTTYGKKDCAPIVEETIRNISVVSQDSAQTLMGQLSSMNQSLLQNIQQLATSMNNNDMRQCFGLRDVLLETQANVTESLQSIMTDSITLKSCEKNRGISVLSDPNLPYPLVRPNKYSPFDFPYLCDTLTDGGGWIIIQRRSTGNVDFFRTWGEYKNGFGSLDDDFWLGNDKIHAISTSATYELRVNLKYKRKSSYAHYSSFSISDEKSNYILSLGAYNGTAGDSLSYHKGRQFSTRDRDNDAYTENCALKDTGAWWYGSCYASSLNGKWGANSYKGPSWRALTESEPTSFTEMKIRRVDDS